LLSAFPHAADVAARNVYKSARAIKEGEAARDDFSPHVGLYISPGNGRQLLG